MITNTIINLKDYEGTLEDLKEFLDQFFKDERNLEIRKLVSLRTQGLIFYDFEPLRINIINTYEEISRIIDETFKIDNLSIINFRDLFSDKLKKSDILEDHTKDFLSNAIIYEDVVCNKSISIKFNR